MQEQPKFYAYKKKETQLIQEEEDPLDEISKKIIARAYSGQNLTHISKYPMRPTMMRNSTTSMLVWNKLFNIKLRYYDHFKQKILHILFLFFSLLFLGRVG